MSDRGKKPSGRVHDPDRRTKRIKLTVSCTLTGYAIVLSGLSGSVSCSLAALAMGVSTLGDAALAGYPKGLMNRLVKGGLLFFVAHALYIAALVMSSGRPVQALLPGFLNPFAVFFALTVLHGAVFYFRARSKVPRAFFAAAFLYLLGVGVHVSAAFSVLPGRGYPVYAAGALLFYCSDAALLARKHASLRQRWIPALIWVTYVPAQICLLTGLYLHSLV